MALSTSSYGSVATCRLYVDYIQYAKAIDYVDLYTTSGNIVETETMNDVWDYNPANMNRYNCTGTSGNINFGVRFKNYTFVDGAANKQWSRFLSSMNYFGVLGHKFGFQCREGLGLNQVNLHLWNDYYQVGESHVGSSETAGIVGDPNNCQEAGYSIYEIIREGGCEVNDNWSRASIYLYKSFTDQTDYPFQSYEYVDIGCFTMGRFFDFPFNCNLSMNIKRGYEGIKTKNTASGKSITDINYYKQPDWGDLPAWKHISVDTLADNQTEDTLDYKGLSLTGRREWNLTWSFLSKEDTFPKTAEGTMSGIFEHSSAVAYYDSFDGTVHQGNIMGSLMTYSMGGQIPMLFQPDKTKQEFAKVRIDSKSISIRRSAPELYTCKLKLVEDW